jgi:hypothetical protein
MVKWSSMRKGERFRSLGVPIERRTRAPTPSDCSVAWKARRIARGIDMIEGGGWIVVMAMAVLSRDVSMF